MSAYHTTASSRNLLKTIPGLLISAFFLWYTFRGISFNQILALRCGHPAWILGVLGFTFASYTLRCVRWTQMMPRAARSLRAHFLVCARVLMTSLAANNILPLRIGDIMRIFTYADDLGASPSVILSTVILEKLLDIFVLVLMFVATVGRVATPHLRLIANISARHLRHRPAHPSRRSPQLCRRPFNASSLACPTNPKLAKIEHWITLALDATGRLGVIRLTPASLPNRHHLDLRRHDLRLRDLPPRHPRRSHRPLAGRLLRQSLLPHPQLPRSHRPLRTRSQNLPRQPRRLRCRQAAIFGLAIHAWMLVSVTGAGGIIFLIHRIRIHNRTPLFVEIEELPTETAIAISREQREVPNRQHSPRPVYPPRSGRLAAQRGPSGRTSAHKLKSSPKR